jgi:transcriptional regulator with XRE-family HTH domain
MKLMGVNIKRLREEKGITLRTMATNLGISPSFLSQIETGKASPSLDTLKSISDHLGTTVGTLIGENQKPSHSPVVRSDERKNIERLSSGVNIYLLASQDPNKQMEPLLFRMSEKATSGPAMYKHFGQEFVLVLRGTIEITLNDAAYILKKGDSIYFNSSTPHSFRNLDKNESEAIWVVTPPTF